MNGEAIFQCCLIVIVCRHCCIVDERSLVELDITPYTDSYYITLSFKEAWFVVCFQKQMTWLEFEIRAPRASRNISGLVMFEWYNFEFFAACTNDQSVLYVSVVASYWATYTAHCSHGDSTPPVLSYPSTLVLGPCHTQHYLVYTVAFPKLPVCALERLHLATTNDVLSILGMDSR